MNRRCIMITGAGSGFGRAASLSLAEGGHDVIAAVHYAAQVDEMRDEASARGVALRVEQMDLLSETDRDRARDWGVDVLVNNAAIGAGGPIAEIPLEQVRAVFEVNVFATLALTQTLVPRMVTRGWGRVIFVSSIAGLTAGAYLGAYAASKHALEAIADAMASELAPHGVTVATLNPGPYATGFNERMVESPAQWYDPGTHFTRPEELASLAARFERQFDPEPLVAAMVELATADEGPYRTVLPDVSEELVRTRQRQAWERRQAGDSSVRGSAGRQTVDKIVEERTHAMAEDTAPTRTRPGRKQGETGELTTFWKVKKGHEAQLRAVLEQLNTWPLEEKAHAGNLIGTLHDRRWVLFDDDTRMMFSTNYDGEWDPYIEAFAEHNAAAFNMILQHIEGCPEDGLKDPGIFDFIIDHQVTANEYMRFYDGTVREIQQALALRKAFEALLDSPEFQQAVRDPANERVFGTPEFQAVLDHAAG